MNINSVFNSKIVKSLFKDKYVLIDFDKKKIKLVLNHEDSIKDFRKLKTYFTMNILTLITLSI